MKYPKAMMRKSELINMGFPNDLLDRAYRARGQRFAQKVDTTKRNSPIVFDTELFEQWRMKELVKENQVICGRY